MELKTKFNVGDTVYFLNDNTLYKGDVNDIIINVRSVITEFYNVKFVNREDYEECTIDIGADSLFESAKEVVDNLMLDFENSDKEND